MTTQYVTRVNSAKWYTQDGQLLIDLYGSCGVVEGRSYNAEHLRALATAALEAAHELERSNAADAEQVRAG